MSILRTTNQVYKAFLGDDERSVQWRLIPVHIWGLEAYQRMIQEQDNDHELEPLTTTIIDKEQYLVRNHKSNIQYEELISDNPRNSTLYRVLRLKKVSHENCRLIIHKVAILARSITMPNVRPIFVIIADITTYGSRQVMNRMIEEADNTTAVATSMEEEVVKIVPAAKFSIDELEKVKMKLDGRCSICLEEFACEEDEIVQMPCSHVYHSRCIVKWLECNHLCPLCRFEMPKSSN